ncbi:DOMON domain protein (macronuclear) [Tetrahymena thermophila SB210]|uniref:DOMON domain protein n=1 Tax=Tetrahymena thermophila (strain SB210) TaxID=312017 RepID=I7LTI7_TETTS|nr:DOMON domain protein [Tetrahymena thermophila SB210]EAR85320.2 DOMON domain protein [Tetrahymena thermophila SB210]|eukprot:XP_001032983.2 DOMON domain protein [Tetrahymena thermophila SB210]
MRIYTHLCVLFIVLYTNYQRAVLAQNTRDPSIKYKILTNTKYVNRIDLTNSGFSLFYGISKTNPSQLYFYFLSTPPVTNISQLELIFGSTTQSVYSMVFQVSKPLATYVCNVLDQFYTNGTPSGATPVTTNVQCDDPGQPNNMNTNYWDYFNQYTRLINPANGFQIVLNQPMNIQFIVSSGGGTQRFTYTITLYSQKYCHGICAAGQCDGPNYNDCLSCADPQMVSVHNYCVYRDPDYLPQPATPPSQQSQWNKFEYMNDKFNASIYYGFRKQNTFNYCYFRIVVNQSMITSTPGQTPSWIGFSFQNTHKSGTAPFNDMVIITYLSGYSATATPDVTDYHSESPLTFPLTPPPGNAAYYPVKDTAQNYVYARGGYDGSSKWDVSVVRMCDLEDLKNTAYFDQGAFAAYYDLNNDVKTLVQCNFFNAGPCLPLPQTPTSYSFSMVVGLLPWDSANMMNNKHYQKISQLTYPITTPASSSLVNTKFCPNCSNQQLDCLGPEQQDCTTCAIGYQFDPHYPISGPGICIKKIIPCHSDCAQCLTSYNDGCTSCTDSTKFLYYSPLLGGRCITSNTLFWNKVDLGTTDLSFYYGWDSSFEFIYFKFVGTIQGWVGVLFSTTNSGAFTPSKDTFQFSKPGISPTSIPVKDASCSNGSDCFKGNANSPTDSIQLVQTIPSSIWTNTNLNAIMSRQAIPSVVGSSDQVIDDNYKGVIIYYDTTSTDPTIQSGATFKTVALPTQQFLKTQVCAPNCITCSGPEITDCLSCATGYALAGSAPNQCVSVKTTGCNPPCATCQTSNINKCITCLSTIKVVYGGSCISSYPLYWNKIYFNQANFTVYYGFDSSQTNIYFRITGQNNGWIGFGFMDRNLAQSKHLKTDMWTFRQSNGNILIEDRASFSQAQPMLDTNIGGKNDLQYIQGGRDSLGYWDIYFVRACNTGDSTQGLDFTFQPNIYFYLSFAYGPSDILTGHSQYFTITTILKTTQICDQTCQSCTGPELYQCTSCQSGFLLSASSPSPCVLNQQPCYQTCQTCTGPTASNCITCANNQYLQAGGLCVPQSPTFWNKIPITGTNLYLYYGYDTALQNIYFRLKGTGPSGWLGMAFQKVKQQMDMIVLRMVNGNTIIEDKFSQYHNYLPSDDIGQGGSKDYYYITGGRSGANTWDVTFMRVVADQDTKFDAIIDSRAYSLSFAYGASDTFDAHTAVYSIDNVYFLTKQVCDSSCLTCQGPETTDCLSCPSGTILSGNAPSICINPGTNCDPSCATCSGPGQSNCLTCSSVNKISYFGTCINSTPSVWNRVDVNSNFVFYYGYDAGGSYIYFRAVGTSPGWFGVGFNGSMLNTDMHIVRIPSTIVQVEDRYSLGHVQPLLDLSQNLVTIKGTLAGSNLDCTWVRSAISPDTTYDIPLNFNSQINLIFAFGATQVFNKHTSVYTVNGVTLSRQQQCSTGCLKCTGPDPQNCSLFNNSTTTNNTNSVIWNYSSIVSCLFSLYMIIILLF